MKANPSKGLRYLSAIAATITALAIGACSSGTPTQGTSVDVEDPGTPGSSDTENSA